ncbi:putative alpha/Beta hydrolase [Arabidopsis thaliana]
MGDSPASSNRVKLRDGRFLAYKERGVPKEKAKYKIILVHGFGSSKDMNFSASKELIEELEVYLLFYDRSGYGESDSNTKRSLESEVEDIAELADQLELGPKLSGVAFVAPVVNYRWPSLPKKLIKKDYRTGIIKWGLRISKYAPGLLHWWIIQKLFASTSSVLESNPVYFNSHDIEVLKRKTGFPMLTKEKLRERNVFDTLRDDFMVCFGQWDFEPADLSISTKSYIHIWHGKEDKVVPFQLQRCILQKQPLINYHEIPQGGHLIVHYDGICDTILRALLLKEEQQKLYKIN